MVLNSMDFFFPFLNVFFEFLKELFINRRLRGTELVLSFIFPLADLAEMSVLGPDASEKTLQHDFNLVIEEADYIFMVGYTLKT